MITNALNNGLSGMRAAQSALDVSSHNIANMNTQGFKPQQIVQSENSTGGVSTAVRAPAAESADTAGKPEAAASGTDAATEMVNSLQFRATFDLNAKMVKTADEMLGTLVNTKA
ncbi:MAG: flagellar basal body protein [Undibacterium curvum]|uniref:flagellar basal body protein n=1 Tax=Undibacterium curvum TaxID=2762294 RepID=UPI003BBD7760